MIGAGLIVLALCASPISAQIAPKPDDPTIGAAPDPVAQAPCSVLLQPIRFCGTPPQFTLTPQCNNAAVTAYFVTPEAIQAIAIIEALGLRDGLTIPALQQAALEVLAAASGQPAGEIAVLDHSTVDIAGVAQPNFVYAGFVEGANIVYSNSIVLLDDIMAQFVTLDIGATAYTSRHRELHTRFLSNVQVDQ